MWGQSEEITETVSSSRVQPVSRLLTVELLCRHGGHNVEIQRRDDANTVRGIFGSAVETFWGHGGETVEIL